MATVSNKRFSVSKKKRLEKYEKEILKKERERETGVCEEYSLINYTIQNIWR
jgi:hypothetical protein